MNHHQLPNTPPDLQLNWALFLDVDGCLLDHAPSPLQVYVPRSLGKRLCEIRHLLRGALAFVSGRSIEALDGLFPECSDVCASGLHGLERRMTGHRLTASPSPAALAALTAQANDLVGHHRDICIEANGPCLNLHWRAAPDAARALSQFAEAALAQLPGYCLHRGPHGVEIRPAGSDKGRAIANFMNLPPFLGRRPVFVGDDPADECGFSEVNARDGISVLVGTRTHSAARHRLSDPSHVRDWLDVREVV